MEKGTEDTSKLVQIEEVKCAIEKLPFVTVLSPVRAVKGKGRGYGVTLRCPSCEEYGSCGKKQEPPVHVSSVHPTEEACLKELLKRLQDRHVNCAEAVAKKAAADGCAWLFTLEAHCLEGRPVHCAAWSRYKESGGEGSRVGCQGLALGEARCVGLCAGSGAMVH